MHASREEMVELRKAIYPLTRKLAVRLARKRRHGRKGPLDFRSTVRHSLQLRRRAGRAEVPLPAAGQARDLRDRRHLRLGGRLRPLHAAPRVRHQPTSSRRCGRSCSSTASTRSPASSRASRTSPRPCTGSTPRPTWCGSTATPTTATPSRCSGSKWGKEIGPKTTVIILGDARNNYHASQSWVVKEMQPPGPPRLLAQPRAPQLLGHRRLDRRRVRHPLRRRLRVPQPAPARAASSTTSSESRVPTRAQPPADPLAHVDPNAVPRRFAAAVAEAVGARLPVPPRPRGPARRSAARTPAGALAEGRCRCARGVADGAARRIRRAHRGEPRPRRSVGRLQAGRARPVDASGAGGRARGALRVRPAPAQRGRRRRPATPAARRPARARPWPVLPSWPWSPPAIPPVRSTTSSTPWSPSSACCTTRSPRSEPQSKSKRSSRKLPRRFFLRYRSSSSRSRLVVAPLVVPAVVAPVVGAGHRGVAPAEEGAAGPGWRPPGRGSCRARLDRARRRGIGGSGRSRRPPGTRSPAAHRNRRGTAPAATYRGAVTDLGGYVDDAAIAAVLARRPRRSRS